MPTAEVRRSANQFPINIKSSKSLPTQISNPMNMARSKKKKKNKTNTKKQKSYSQCSFSTSRPNSNLSIKTESKNAGISRSSTDSTLSSTTKLPSICGQMSPRLVSPPRKVPMLPQEILPVACERRRKLPLLAAIKPDNEKAEKERFMRANYMYNPYFIYRFPADPEILEKASQPSDRLLHLVSIRWLYKCFNTQNCIKAYCPPLSLKCWDIKSHSYVCPSVHPSVRLSVTKTLIWLISSEVLKIEHWYLACMIFVTSPFKWRHAVTLTFDLFQGQSCCRAGDQSIPWICLFIKEWSTDPEILEKASQPSDRLLHLVSIWWLYILHVLL